MQLTVLIPLTLADYDIFDMNSKSEKMVIKRNNWKKKRTKLEVLN